MSRYIVETKDDAREMIDEVMRGKDHYIIVGPPSTIAWRCHCTPEVAKEAAAKLAADKRGTYVVYKRIGSAAPGPVPTVWRDQSCQSS